MCVRCQIQTAMDEPMPDWNEIIKLATLAKFGQLDVDGYAPEPVVD